MPVRARPVSGPVEIVDRALAYVGGNLSAAFCLSVAPNLLLSEALLASLVRARELAARENSLWLVSGCLALAFLLKGIFVAAQVAHTDSILAGNPRPPSACIAAAWRQAPRAVAARSLWVLILAAGCATGVALSALPVAVIGSRRSISHARRLIGGVLLRPARPAGEGWSKIPLLQLLLAAIFLFLLLNVAALQALTGYLISGLPGGWSSVREMLSPSNPYGLACAVLIALSLFGPVATAAACFLEEDLEGRLSGRDLEARLAQLEQ